jgi:uncharacterized protein YjbJ (UPF0337 family)
MGDDADEPIESPATWENVVVGKAKEVLGHAIGDEELTQEGEDQEEVAHEVREEFEEEHQD